MRNLLKTKRMLRLETDHVNRKDDETRVGTDKKSVFEI